MIYTFTSITFFILSLLMWDYRRKDFYYGLEMVSLSKYVALKKVMIIACIWLILHDGLRWEIGTDWGSYYDFFYNLDNPHLGPGYYMFVAIVRKFTTNYTLFVLIIALFQYVVIYNLIKKYSINPLASFCIYYCNMIGILGSNRTIIACTFCIISLHYIFEKNFLFFIICIIAATMFHATALVFLPAYFLYNLSFTQKKCLTIIFVSLFIGITHLIDKLPFIDYLNLFDQAANLSTSFASYVGDFTEEVSMMGSIKRIIYALICIWTMNKVKSQKYQFILKLYIIGVCIYLCFNGSVIQMMAGRGATYYDIYECIVLPFAILNIPTSDVFKKMLWLVVFVVYFYLMWRNMNIYYVLDGIDIFNPYKSVLGFQL